MARMLDAALTGRVLQSTDFRIPRYSGLSLAGSRVGSVVSRGKHLLIRTGQLSIHCDLTADGRWDVYAPGERWRSPSYKARCVLKNADFQAIGFEMAFLQVIHTVEEPAVVGHLGPDPLGHYWDSAEALRRLAINPVRPIGPALVDQRLIAGLGNVFRSELLFLARVNPHLPVGEVRDLAHVVELAHQLLHSNKDSARRITTPASHPEPYWVYGRGGLPCPRCGDDIVHERMGTSMAALSLTVSSAEGVVGSSVATQQPRRFADGCDVDVFWCPNCQALPTNVAAATTSAH